MLGLSKKQLWNELRLAVIAWGCLYGFLFVALLIYRYNTYSYYLSQKAKAEALLLQHASGVDTAKQRIVKQVPKANPLQPYEAKLEEMTQELTAAHHSVQAKLETLQHHLETLESWKNSPLLKVEVLQHSSTAGTDISPLLEHWQQLLSLPSLQEVSDEQLDLMFGRALGEMEAALQEPSTLDWNQLQQWLENDDMQRQDSELKCPSGNPRRRRRRQKYPHAAYQSDLEHKMKELDDYFSKRTPAAGVRALGPNSHNALKEETVQGARVMLHEILEFVNDIEQRVASVAAQQHSEADGGAAASVSCDNDLELVTALVDAGLKAMAVHGDVREALRRTTLENDPSIEEDDLILDADLPLALSDKEMESTVINLRSVIETPVLVKAMDWIDDLADLVGGYNDRLDQYLDSLTDGKSESVGEVVVERLLHNAGLINIDVKKVGEKVKLSPSIQRKIMEKFD